MLSWIDLPEMKADWQGLTIFLTICFSITVKILVMHLYIVLQHVIGLKSFKMEAV